MRTKTAQRLDNGIYFLYWKSGGWSIGAVGRTETGMPWFAPTNWINVPCTKWSMIESVSPILTSRQTQELLDHGRNE